MLNHMQLELLFFLNRYPVADQRACLTVMDVDNTGDTRMLTYALRPLVKNKYISRRDDGLYSILAKGKSNFVFPLMTCGGNSDSRKRAAEIAGVAALFQQHGILSVNRVMESGRFFIPSPVWRTIREGLISTVRFCGMLYYDGMRLAVYDIGDGSMEWQTCAERSLHFRDYGTYETRATGILLICDDGLGVDVGKQIIRNTMLRRKDLIKDENEHSWENPKKRPFSKSPIRLRSDYQHAYLAERGEVMDILSAIAAKQKIDSYFCEKLDLEENHDWRGRFLERHPERYYINLDNDLLQLVVLLNKLRDYNQMEIRHHIVMRAKYKELAELYGTDLNILAVSERDIPCIMN